MIVDSHHHLWDPATRAYPWLEADGLEPIRRPYRLDDLRTHAGAADVHGTVLVQTVPDVSETRDLLRIAEQSQGLVRGVVGWADLTDPGLSHRLRALRAGPGGHHLVGIRHQAQDEDDPRWLLRPEVLRGLHAVAEQDLVYDLLVLPHQLPAAVGAVAQVPEGRFVLDHAAKPPVRSGELDPWETDLRRLAAHGHVSCKLSGLVTEADWQRWEISHLRPYAEVVLDAFGPRRVMAGSDWPVCELAASYPVVWQTLFALLAGLSQVERADVLAGTATRSYRLTAGPRPETSR